MLLVELHHLFVETLAITLVLVLQLLHLWLQTLHLQHSLGALQGEWGDEQHDGQSHQSYGNGVVVRPSVEGVDEPGKWLKHGEPFLGMPFGGWDGVESGRSEWATPQEATGGEP